MPAAFPFFRNFTASSTYSLRMGKLSVSVVREVLSFFMSPVARYKYRSVVYSVHLFKMSLDSVRHFPFLSRMVLSGPACCWLVLSLLGMSSWRCLLPGFLQRRCSAHLSSLSLPRAFSS